MSQHGYAEEQDYSESDCPSDGQALQQPHADVTELYRRKQAAAAAIARNPPATYYHMPGYYEMQGRPPPPCGCNLPPPDHRYCYYKAMPVHHNQEAVYRSSPHLATAPTYRKCQEAPLAKAAASVAASAAKKYPVTARTPRYYRCPATAVCKRPSTLCLPVTCQPDPAVCQRVRKPGGELHHCRGQEGPYAIHDYTMKRTEMPHVIDSEGDVNSRLNDLENLLTKFDDDEEERGGPTGNVEITTVSELSKILKPKIPASIKARQEKSAKTRSSSTADAPVVNKLEVQEATEETLNVLMRKFSREALNKEGDEKQSGSVEDGKQSPRNQTLPMVARQAAGFLSEQKPPLDDNSAIELHRSKSYIVSLIDKALSKELGTVPGEKCSRKEFLSMNPKKAIDLVHRHTTPRPLDKSTALQVAQPNFSKAVASSCVCKSEEPLYLKQLKQLRWSHLRHIQREAKRLADLEKFLDTFGETDGPA